MSDINDLLRYEIYPLIQEKSNIVFPEFGLKRKGNRWEATQGEINGCKAKGHLYHYDNAPFCFKRPLLWIKELEGSENWYNERKRSYSHCNTLEKYTDAPGCIFLTM